MLGLLPNLNPNIILELWAFPTKFAESSTSDSYLARSRIALPVVAFCGVSFQVPPDEVFNLIIGRSCALDRAI